MWLISWGRPRTNAVEGLCERWAAPASEASSSARFAVSWQSSAAASPCRRRQRPSHHSCLHLRRHHQGRPPDWRHCSGVEAKLWVVGSAAKCHFLDQWKRRYNTAPKRRRGWTCGVIALDFWRRRAAIHPETSHSVLTFDPAHDREPCSAPGGEGRQDCCIGAL